VRKAAALEVKKIEREIIGVVRQVVGFQLFMANKVFWQTIHHLHGKRSNSCSSIKHSLGNILSDENEILSR